MHGGREIIRELKAREPRREEVEKVKGQVARRLKLGKIPSNVEILSCAREEEKEFLLPLLRKKPVRSISGITVVAVMSKPAPCPGECIYCPRGDSAPQSYTGHEPAALRARASNYDPYMQVEGRLEQLSSTGHSVDKVEIIVMGGTFPSLSPDYQERFVASCLDAMSNFSSSERSFSRDIFEAQARNESSVARCVGLTFETRPDFARAEQVNRMLALGATRVELGVQTLSNKVYRKVKRGHSVEDVARATRELKDRGLKVGYHMMPGLFSTFEEDRGMFEKLFSDPSFRPDTLKIYPTLVVGGTELYQLWKEGEYEPYSHQEAAELIAEVKRLLPPWVRTMRVQRDIPAGMIEAGVGKGDLGSLALNKLKEKGERCRCIRCRDIGHLSYKLGVRTEPENQVLKVRSYEASEGVEKFLSIEDVEEDALLAYLRMRYPSAGAEKEVEGSALVRELRTLGTSLPIGKQASWGQQHRGLGRRLLTRAEEMAGDEGFNKLLVLSAIGTRSYYSRLGYSREGAYMGKEI